MEMKELHKRWKDDSSPSVEGQIRWLQKQGFAQHHLEQALITMYGEIESGKIPMVYELEGRESLFRSAKEPPPDERWAGREIADGNELDQYLLNVAKQIRTDELTAMIKNMEQFEAKLKAKWEAERKEEKPGFFSRLFGKTPA